MAKHRDSWDKLHRQGKMSQEDYLQVLRMSTHARLPDNTVERLLAKAAATQAAVHAVFRCSRIEFSKCLLAWLKAKQVPLGELVAKLRKEVEQFGRSAVLETDHPGAKLLLFNLALRYLEARCGDFDLELRRLPTRLEEWISRLERRPRSSASEYEI